MVLEIKERQKNKGENQVNLRICRTVQVEYPLSEMPRIRSISDFRIFLDFGIFAQTLPIEHHYSKNPKSNMLQNYKLLLKNFLISYFQIRGVQFVFIS
jgi:hypothetical protein